MWAGLRDLLLMSEIHWKWQCGKVKKGTDSSSWSFFSRDSSFHVLRTFKQPNAEFHIIMNWGLWPTVMRTILEGDSVSERSSLQKIIWWSEDEADDPEDDWEDDPGGYHRCKSWVILSQNHSIQLFPDSWSTESTWGNKLIVFKPVSVSVLHLAAAYKKYTWTEHTVLPGLPIPRQGCE